MADRRKVALITGISGQDGSYLAKLLLHKGYIVVGTSRDVVQGRFENLKRLGVFAQVRLEAMPQGDYEAICQLISRVAPTEIYNLAGQTSVGVSFQRPLETMESIAVGTLQLLEAVRSSGQPIAFYNACSSECFGDTDGKPATETTMFRPRSPYAIAKAASYWEVASYREAYGLYAVSGILFNHESPLRPERFVTRKIIAGACRIAAGSQEKVTLGNLDIKRDWGWAPEYVDAIWRMLQQEVPEDLVIATGETSSLREFTAEAFRCVGLDWRDHVVTEPSLLRPADLTASYANPLRAREKLGWSASSKMREVVSMMIAAERTVQA